MILFQVRDAEQKIHAIIAETPKYVETEVVVPTDTCGRIIGKGGQNIRDMCSASGITNYAFSPGFKKI